MEKLTQYDVILDYLKRNGSITSMEAIKNFSITRLSAIIFMLKKDGYNIESFYKTGKNKKYGWSTHFVEYILKDDKQV